MKLLLRILLVAAVATTTTEAFSQSGQKQMFAIEPYPLQLTERKTTHLVFPFRIITVDRGSSDILAQIAKGTENILQVKAAKADIASSNLTVVTADGKLYGFLVDYDTEPLQLSIGFASEDIQHAALPAGQVNQGAAHALAQRLLSGPDAPSKNSKPNQGAGLSLTGPYTAQGLMLFKVCLSNDSDIDYHSESLRFFVRDKKRARRSAIQQHELRPVYMLADTTVVAGRSEHASVLVFNQFTIAAHKYLAVEAREQNGSRAVSLRLKASRIAGATPLK